MPEDRPVTMDQYPATTPPPAFRLTPQLILGLLIVFVGVIFTLDELGIAPAISYLRYWPMAIIGIGVIKLLQARDGDGAFAGLIFTAVGIWLQAEELDVLHVSLRDVWPLGLVVFGGYLVWQGLRGPAARPVSRDLPPSATIPLDATTDSATPWGEGTRARTADAPAAGSPLHSSFRGSAKPGSADPNATMSVIAIMGGVTRGNNSPAFRGADVLAIMGGCEIDLRKAAINGEAVIDVFAMWGGIEIRVPEDWTVVSHVVPLMGGVDDKTRPPQGATAHRLTLRGFVLMAGVEIKN
jgi:hypothetical protein